MPLLQGQPFKLIKDPELFPGHSELYKIPHTGEKFSSKSDYEDRLALYSQTIWTCQSTGKTGLTHEEAWTSESKAKLSVNSIIPAALQKPLLALVHHSLSPLEQLVDAASILCHSQFHVGEEVTFNPKQTLVRVITSKEVPKRLPEIPSVPNGISSEESSLNGNSNGIPKESPGTSPGKENQTKDSLGGRDESQNKKEMLPKLYDVLVLEDKMLLENTPSKQLQRPYKVPSKDQIRIFIRSSALRQRGASCAPWVVSEELVNKYSLPNKLPTVFLSPPKSHQISAAKRKSHSPIGELSKRPKQDFGEHDPKTVAPLVLKSENYQKSIFNIVKSEAAKQGGKSYLPTLRTSPGKPGFDNMCTNTSKPLLKDPTARAYGIITKHPLSMGKPKILPKSPNFSLPGKSAFGSVPKKRGRPPLTKEEKERNKKMRQATLFELSKKTATECQGKLVKIRTTATPLPSPTSTNSLMPPPGTSSNYLTTQNPNNIITTPYKSPVKRAVTPEAIMKLPFMRRFALEHKTIKGVIGQFRRLSHTMDIVLGKLSPEQIDMIPDEAMKQDLLLRQKKVEDKKFIEKLSPEERKQFMKDRARTVALERWKERKLKNLKIEDKTLSDLVPLPNPCLVSTPADLPNSSFGDAVMVIEFIKCFQGLLLGEEKFNISSQHLMEALCLGSSGFKTSTDILCCLLPTIIHDDISKNSKELGVPIAGIPINYQTAPELARLCLRSADNEDFLEGVEDNWQIGKERSELSDVLSSKLEQCEFWQLNFHEVIAVMKGLVHKVLATAALSVYVEESEEKVLQTLREKRKFFKQLQKEKQIEHTKRKEQRQQNKDAKTNQPKKARGRPKGYSPKLAAINIKEFLSTQPKHDEEVNPVAAVHKRRLSAENLKKEKEEQKKLEVERLKQHDEDMKRQVVEKKYDDIVMKRDNLLRRQPIGYDRDHNRYWLFHSTTPGFYVEKCWADKATSYNCLPTTPQKCGRKSASELNGEVKQEEEEEDDDMSDDDEKPLSIVFLKEEEEEEEEEVKKESDEDDTPLAQIKSKLSITPMKMSCRGRPPKEAYVLVDEDTQTFPTIGENSWHQYKSMEEVNILLESLSDKGQRESQLIAAINLNKERMLRYFTIKPEPYEPVDDVPDRVKQSLKEDIVQIEKELIEGWLGGISEFDAWEATVLESNDLCTLGSSLMEAQRHMQLKYLKGFMAPEKRQLPSDNPDAPPEYEDVESCGVIRWREAVSSCKTYSRLHVLVGLFDSCIKWEKSMATRKCKICRSKMKEDPMLMCDNCETSYHWYCLRPPLKEEPGESWLCPACMPKKTRREEYPSSASAQEEDHDPEEKDDPTFALNSQGRVPRSSKNKRSASTPKKVEKECVVCMGRVGLIVCAHCSAAYHSECHDPPLISRARKDWVCFGCLNPKVRAQKIKEIEEAKENGTTRMPVISKMSPDSKLRNMGPPRMRSSTGQFVKGCVQRYRDMHQFAEEGGEEMKCDEMQEEDEEQIDKFGRSIRGAKVKAIDAMAGEPQGDDSNRRSSRNTDNRKSYKDESEADEESDNEEGSDREEEGNEMQSDEEEEEQINIEEVNEGQNDNEEGNEGTSDNDEGNEQSDNEGTSDNEEGHDVQSDNEEENDGQSDNEEENEGQSDNEEENEGQSDNEEENERQSDNEEGNEGMSDNEEEESEEEGYFIDESYKEG